MSKGNTFEGEWLQHVLANATIPDVGDATGLRGSTTAGSLYLSLHTADPGEAGNQTTNEIAYTGYARPAIARAGASWNFSGNQAQNAAEQLFPEMTGGAGGTATWVMIGTAASGTGKQLYRAQITNPASGLPIAAGITPHIPANGFTITEE